MDKLHESRMPGRWLDHHIAHWVFGLEVGYTSGGWPFIQGPRTDLGSGIRLVSGSNLLHYSTDIRAAWTVVEKLKEHGPRYFCCITLRMPVAEPIEFELIQGGSIEHGPKFIGVADTVSHAICLAALKAVGQE